MLQHVMGTSSLYGLLEELKKFMQEKLIWAATPKGTPLMQELHDLEIGGS